MDTASFDYDLPPDRIAQTPIEPRHASRLLDTRNLSDHEFLELPSLLEPGDLVVVNTTRVRHARLHGTKAETGGAVEALVLRRLDEEIWEAMVKPARRLHGGTRIDFGHITAELIDDPVDGIALIRMKAPIDIEAALTGVGEMPLPPYITTRLDRPDRYQTIFADRPGSAAAPTAGLHFTADVLDALDEAGISVASVDLQVGLATFRPISTDTIEAHLMHRETCSVDTTAAEAVASCRHRGGRVVAIGTTVVRTLETFAAPDGTVEAGTRDSDLFLKPGSRFGVVDVLVTNFHLPRSSLLVLVEAFMGPRWRDAYGVALDRGYRFLSFGDAMLCERAAS